ncbi:MAG: 4a-hydroxytetrahydrobiopterin dehydratase [Synechococcales cyanobacterium RU_4_20]|nr:4a-hydroxytetrahydrobiopterin dehydratase [Synechococcales cyanobacterium RU_4_20]NJR71199.1 4a-hydroxytetrahydrobiopterin dehydratase [Synechococcales cyanobacterium CRU_2_2]
MAALLSDSEVQTRARQLSSEWSVKGKELTSVWKFKGFVEAIAFLNKLVAPAEAAGHHPDLSVSYNKVTVSLTTHDAGGLTQQDFDLAEIISRL